MIKIYIKAKGEEFEATMHEEKVSFDEAAKVGRALEKFQQKLIQQKFEGETSLEYKKK